MASFDFNQNTFSFILSQREKLSRLGKLKYMKEKKKKHTGEKSSITQILCILLVVAEAMLKISFNYITILNLFLHQTLGKTRTQQTKQNKSSP